LVWAVIELDCLAALWHYLKPVNVFNQKREHGKADVRVAQGILIVALVTYLVVNHFYQQQEFTAIQKKVEELNQTMSKQVDDRTSLSDKYVKRLNTLSDDVLSQTAAVEHLQKALMQGRDDSSKTLSDLKDELAKAQRSQQDHRRIISELESEMKTYLSKAEKADDQTSKAVKNLLLELDELKTSVVQPPQGKVEPAVPVPQQQSQ